MSRKGKLDIVLHDILIEDIAAEGKSIAHARLDTDDPQSEGRVLFVEFAVPGDADYTRAPGIDADRLYIKFTLTYQRQSLQHPGPCGIYIPIVPPCHPDGRKGK